jgi:hypothetical protein
MAIAEFAAVFWWIGVQSKARKKALGWRWKNASDFYECSKPPFYSFCSASKGCDIIYWV